MKKIILGTLVLLTIGMGFGFAQTQKKNDTETKTETKSSSYYKGYNQATDDYTNGGNYDPSSCNRRDEYNDPFKRPAVEKRNNQKKYECIQGYQDSWKRNSEVAPKTPKDNSNNQ